MAAYTNRWRGYLPPRLHDGLGGDRLEAAQYAVSVGAVAGLGEDEESERALRCGGLRMRLGEIS
jgi:hypothetical protein